MVVYEIDGCNIVATGAKVALQKVTAFALSSDGARLAVANQKRILIYNLADGLEVGGKCWDISMAALCIVVSTTTATFIFFLRQRIVH